MGFAPCIVASMPCEVTCFHTVSTSKVLCGHRQAGVPSGGASTRQTRQHETQSPAVSQPAGGKRRPDAEPEQGGDDPEGADVDSLARKRPRVLGSLPQAPQPAGEAAGSDAVCTL